MNAPSHDAYDSTTKNIYFVLPAQSLRPNQGYIFSLSEKGANFQIPEEACKAPSVIEFCIVVNEDLKWTLVEGSVTGVSLNSDKIHSAEKQKFLAGVGYHLSNPQSQMANGEPNSTKFGGSGLHLTLYVLSKAANYNHHSSNASVSQPNQSTNFSPYPQQLPESIAGTHKLTTTDDIDAELLRQTGGDLTKGFYIDPARCVKAARLCQPLVSRRKGGDADCDVEIDEQGWTVLDGLDKFDLQARNG